MARFTHHSVKLVAAAAMTGATFMAGGGAQAATPATVSEQASASAAATPDQCAPGYFCAYNQTYYVKGVRIMTNQHPTCSSGHVLTSIFAIKSFKNRTKYRWLIQSGALKIYVPAMGTTGAFRPAVLVGADAWLCTY